MPPVTITPPAYARERTFTIAVSGSSGDKSERAIIRPESDDGADGTDRVGKMRLTVVNAPAGFQLHVETLKPGGTVTTEGDWRSEQDTTDQTGVQPMLDMNFHNGVSLVGERGSANGDIVVDVAWEARA
jgi:hypothetical protein